MGERRIHTLAYADDIVISAEDAEGMKVMLERLKRYLDKKGFELNVEKTKVRCRKVGGR